jgi:hypothetical protein
MSADVQYKRMWWHCTEVTRFHLALLAAALAMACVFALLTSQTVYAATCTWTGAVDDNWLNPANWSGCNNNVPGAGDVVILGGSATLNASASVFMLQLSGGTLAGGGTLDAQMATVTSGQMTGSVSVRVYTMTMLGGQWNSGGGLTIWQSFAWSGGELNGPGWVTLATGSTAQFDGGTMLNTTLVNHGIVTWLTSNVNGAAGTFRNEALGEFKAQAVTFSFQPALVNRPLATLRKSTASTTWLKGRVTNDGQVRAEAGTLEFDSLVDGSGSFVAQAGATLRFDSLASFDGDSSISGAGTVAFNGANALIAGTYVVTTTQIGSSGVMQVNSAATTERMTLSGGTLTGTGHLTATGVMTWTGGTMGGAGVTTLAPGAALYLPLGGGRTLDRVLSNYGVIVWQNGGLLGGGHIINQAGSALDARPASANSLYPDLTISAGAVLTISSNNVNSLHGAFTNTGVVNILSGTLSVRGGGVSSGDCLIAAGATLDVSAYDHAFVSEGEISGAGRVYLSSGDLVINGERTAPGSLEMVGGILWLHKPMSATQVDFSSGVLTGTGDLTVTQVMTWAGGVMGGAGAMTIVPGATLTWQSVYGGTLDRTLNNQGTIHWKQGPVQGGGQVNIHKNGVLDIQLATAASFYPRLINHSGGTVTVLAGGTPRLRGSFTNMGTLELQTTLDLDHSLVQLGGITRLNGGNLQNAGSNVVVAEFYDGVVEGSGTLNGVTRNYGARFEPGDIGATGVLTVSGPYWQGPTGKLRIEVGGNTPGASFDALKTGDSSLSGTLQVSLISLFIPADGERFDIIEASSIRGGFAPALLPSVGAPLTPIYTSHDVSLRTPSLLPPGEGLKVTVTTDDVYPPAFNYSLRYTNTSPYTGVNMLIRLETLPHMDPRLDASTPGWTCSSQVHYKCNLPLGDVPPGSSGGVTFTNGVKQFVPWDSFVGMTYVRGYIYQAADPLPIDFSFLKYDRFCLQERHCLFDTLALAPCNSLVQWAQNWLGRAQQAAQQAAQTTINLWTYYRARDEILRTTPAGQRYIDLYYQHSPALISATLTSPVLVTESLALMERWQPYLDAWVNGQGNDVVIGDDLAQETETYLDHLYAASGPELQQAIAQERARTPIGQLVGLTLEQARAQVIGYPKVYLPLILKNL